MSLFGEVSSSAALFYWLRYFIVAPPVPLINIDYFAFYTLSNQKRVYSVRVVPSKQHTCRCNSTGKDKIQQKAPTSSFSELNTLVWEHRANFSAINYFKLCIFCSEGFFFLFVRWMGCVILLWHYLGLPYNIFYS